MSVRYSHKNNDGKNNACRGKLITVDHSIEDDVGENEEIYDAGFHNVAGSWSASHRIDDSKRKL